MDIKYSDKGRKETTHSGAQLPKKINNHLVTQRQIGYSQPFSPLELITMYPEWKAVPKKCQQTGDNLEEKGRYTFGRGPLHGDDNSICVYDLIFVY